VRKARSINKRKLTNSIYKKINKAVPQKLLLDCVEVITEHLIQSVIDDKAVSIDNFGTFSTYTIPPHNGLNISSGIMREVRAKKLVKFRPHIILTELINQKRKKFS